MKRILLLFLMLPASLAAATQIQDTGYTGINGALFSGRLTITSPNMTAARMAQLCTAQFSRSPSRTASSR